MHILVLGATGYLGTHITEHLRALPDARVLAGGRSPAADIGVDLAADRPQDLAAASPRSRPTPSSTARARPGATPSPSRR